jgi:hypothetical protein
LEEKSKARSLLHLICYIDSRQIKGLNAKTETMKILEINPQHCEKA